MIVDTVPSQNYEEPSQFPAMPNNLNTSNVHNYQCKVKSKNIYENASKNYVDNANHTNVTFFQILTVLSI